MSATRRRRRATAGRGAFTLVELLIAITIITILAAVTLFSLHSMTEYGKETQTRATVARIDRLLMLRWETYRTRPAPIRLSAGTSPRVAASRRLRAIRELMRKEMPDRKSDLVAAGTDIIPPPSLWLSYRRRASIVPGWTPQYQGAECLYMIIASIQQGDRNGLDFFNAQDIGDKDGDGMFEIHDAWHNPIEFVRWAPGYRSLLQDRIPVKSPDPFDPIKADPRWINGGPPANALFAMHPLVVSAGPDKSYGLRGLVDPGSNTAPPTFSYSATGPPNDPYFNYNNAPLQLGYRLNVGTYPDNIHNHSVEGD